MHRSGYWSRLERTRVSRRALLAAAGATTAGAAVTACGGEDEKGVPATPTAAALGTPRSGGKATLAVSADVGNLDPNLSIATTFVGGRLYCPLHAINKLNQELVPLVAESVEQPDETTYIWNLRKGVKFQNVDPTFGREVIAEDVVYTFDRLKSQPNINDTTLLTLQTDSFEAVDNYTFKLKTRKPYSPALDKSGLAQYCIVAREAVEKWGDLSQHAAGCGPWMLVEHTRDERLRMRKNPDYFEAGRPFPDEEEWLVVAEEGTLWQMLRTGRLDFPLWLHADKFKREEVKNDASIVVAPSPDVSPPLLYTRVDRPPFNDGRVQEAIDLAIDRDDYIDKMYFGEGRYNGPVPWTLEYWALPQEELRAALKHDPDKARQLLSAAGYADGLQIQAKVRSDDDAPMIATVIADQLRKVGIDIEITTTDVGVWLVALFGSDFEMTVSRTLPLWEPDAFLRYYHSAGGGTGNLTKFNDPEVDSLIEGTWAIFDLEERRQAVLDLQRELLRKHAPMHPLCTGDGYVAFSSRLKGIDPRTGLIYWMGTEYWIEDS